MMFFDKKIGFRRQNDDCQSGISVFVLFEILFSKVKTPVPAPGG